MLANSAATDEFSAFYILLLYNQRRNGHTEVLDQSMVHSAKRTFAYLGGGERL